MQSNYHTYLKLAFTQVKLFRHIQSQANNKRKQPQLEFLIDVDYFIQKNKIESQLQKVKLQETLTNEGSVFYPQQDRWDAVLLKQNFNQTKSFLRIKCQINKKISKFESKNILNPPEKTSKNQGTQTYLNQQKGTTQKSQNLNIIDLPIKDIEITIPLQKFFNQPYHIHQIGMDFYLPSLKKHQIIEKSQTNNEIQQTSFKKKQKQIIQRDGVIYFQLVYMPNIKNQLLLRNIMLKTNHFAQKCKLYVSHLIQDHSEGNKVTFKKYQNENHRQQDKSVPKKTNSSKLELLLQPNQWKTYLNHLSFESPLILPLTLNNDLDQIQFFLECEIKNKNQQQRGKQQSSKITFSQIEEVEQFYNSNKKKDPISSTRTTKKLQQFCQKKLFFKQNNQTFQIRFEYQLIMQGLQNQPEEFQGIGSIALETHNQKFYQINKQPSLN